MARVAQYHPGAGKDWRRKVTTHCVNGHAYTPENTLWREEGWRSCRTCNRDAARLYQRQRRAHG